jgi:hypothetical protein
MPSAQCPISNGKIHVAIAICTEMASFFASCGMMMYQLSGMLGVVWTFRTGRNCRSRSVAGNYQGKLPGFLQVSLLLFVAMSEEMLFATFSFKNLVRGCQRFSFARLESRVVDNGIFS